MNSTAYTANKGLVSSPLRIIIIIGLLVTVIEFFTRAFSSDPALSSLYITQLCIIFFASYAESVRRLGWLHLFSLLHFATFVFMIGTMFLSLFNLDELIRVVVSPTYNRFSEPVIQNVTLVFSAYIAITNLAFFSGYNRQSIERDSQFFITKDDYFKVGRAILLIGLPVSIWVGFFYLNNVDRVASYAAGDRGAMGLPLWARILDTLTIAGYYLVSASTPRYKEFVKYTLLYTLTLVPTLFYGERGDTLMIVLFFFWYRYKVYGKSIKFAYLAFFGIIGIGLSYYIQIARQGELAGGSLLSMLFNFFEGSSTTVKLSCFYVQDGDHLINKYPFFLDQAISGLFGLFGESYTGQSLHTLSGRSSLAHSLTYYVNPNYYLAGANMGTAWVTECYEFGLIGVMIGGIALAKFIQLVDTRLFKSKYWRIFVYMFFSLIILSPRGNIIPSLYILIKFTVIIGALLLGYHIVTGKSTFVQRNKS